VPPFALPDKASCGRLIQLCRLAYKVAKLKDLDYSFNRVIAARALPIDSPNAQKIGLYSMATIRSGAAKAVTTLVPAIVLLSAILVFIGAQKAERADAQTQFDPPVQTPQIFSTAQTLQNRHIVGYQGWFTCPVDKQERPWEHWFRAGVDVNQMVVDMMPAADELTPSERCETGLTDIGGHPVAMFSSLNAQTVDSHVRWMSEYGIDGFGSQRFLVELKTPMARARRDRVLKNLMDAARKYGRAFFISYDITGADPATWAETMKSDFAHLVQDLGILNHPGYWREKGLPVLEIWGLGFTDRPGTADEALALIRYLKTYKNGLTVIGGVPSRWRLLNGDSKSDAGWATVYRELSVLSPWTIGRYTNQASFDSYIKNIVEPDMALVKQTQQGYIPVVWPGFSFRNGARDEAKFNRIPRLCGSFYNMQLSIMSRSDVTMLFTSMFDEVDEGTAIFKVVSKKEELPVGMEGIALDQDGCLLPTDAYLGFARNASNILHSRNKNNNH
jgi:hypothetical protein